jgi:protein ImuB
MTVAQARAVASGGLRGATLRVVPASAADTAAAAAALADVGFAFAPRVEAEGEQIFFEVGDLQSLFPAGGTGSPGDRERAIAQAIAAAAARLGLYVRVGVAASKGVAAVAARAWDIAVIPAGAEAERLAPIDVAIALATRPEASALAETLARWGVKTMGAVAALPAADVALRLGPAGTALHRLCRGRDDEPFAPRLPADALEEGTELDYPILELEPLAFVLRGLLDRALARLGSRGLGCAALALRLKLDPRGFDVREVPLAAPTREGTTLLQLVRLDIARRPPGAPVVGVAVEIRPALVRATQLDLLRPSGPAPEKLAATLARLEAMVGFDNVGAPVAVSTFREEAVALRPYVPPAALAPEGAARAGEAAPLTLGFRRFRPPAPVEVIVDRDGPAALKGRDIAARVWVAAGPYRSESEWWNGEGFSRDYWDVQASDGALYRLHQDRRDGLWYVDGYYD